MELPTGAKCSNTQICGDISHPNCNRSKELHCDFLSSISPSEVWTLPSQKPSCWCSKAVLPLLKGLFSNTAAHSCRHLVRRLPGTDHFIPDKTKDVCWRSVVPALASSMRKEQWRPQEQGGVGKHIKYDRVSKIETPPFH